MDVGEIYTNLQLQRRDGRGHFEDTDTIVSLADIYKTVDVCAKPAVRKIRVEGPPGIGKSCSCRRLAHDWSSGKLHCFKAVFFLEMRHLSGKVKDAIFEQLLPKDIKMTTDQLWSYIEENQKEVLFILDGLDELSQTARESTDVVDLIQGKILRNSHVLVTSRLYHCVEDIEKCHSFYKIVGYSKENSVGFIRKYFSKAPESATKLVEALTNSSNLGEIALNPLNNVLICVVFEENGDNLPSGKAELYQMIIHSIVKRYCTKNGIPIKGRTLPSNIEEALRGLGKLSWEGLQRDQLQFNIDDIRQEFGGSTDDMLNMGLLTRDYSFSRIKRICYCTFLHKTFQEYLAAYYISQLVREESKQDEGVRCLRTLFGVGKTSDVNSPIIKSYEKYREIQNILPVMLGRHADPLFAMFADELMKPGLKGEEREILSFICLMSLGRAGENGQLAEILAPCVSPYITNELGRHDLCKSDHAQWFDGFLQVLSSQKNLAMSPSSNTIEHLKINCFELHNALQQRQLEKLERILSDCPTMRSVALRGRSSIDTDEIKQFLTSDGKEIPLARVFIPRNGVQNVSIKFSVNSNMLEDLSKVPRLEHVEINVGRASNGTGVPKYDPMLAEMVRKQSRLKTLRVWISGWGRMSIKTRQCGSLTETLQSISEHKSLEEVEIKHLVRDDSPRFGGSHDKPETVDVDTVVKALTECIKKSNGLKTLQITWESFFVTRIFYSPVCSSQSLSKLCSAIQQNKTLERLRIHHMFSESKDHQKIIDQLMRNKPENLKELVVTMFKRNVVRPHCFTP
ncbi:NLR family CARD domain-containing protein 4-like [Branchiostoma floridae x Branchiostoma belcheri]